MSGPILPLSRETGLPQDISERPGRETDRRWKRVGELSSPDAIGLADRGRQRRGRRPAGAGRIRHPRRRCSSVPPTPARNDRRDVPKRAVRAGLVRRSVDSVQTSTDAQTVGVGTLQDEEWGDLYGAIDIWCPLFSLFRPESAAKRQAAGETIWTYTALCQRDPTPWWHIDFPLLNYRVPMWIGWRYRIRGLLYWGGMCHWRGVEDPWTDPKTLDRRAGRKDPLYNGEGTIVYPGRAVGYDGIAPSLRLKALRDGIEDYEYLAILERAGLADAAQKVIMPLAGSWFEWEKDPAAYETARADLAKMIVTARAAARR